MTVHFDTLEFVKTLTASGVPQTQAEAMARAHAKSLSDLVQNELASKADLAVLRADMRADFKSEISGLRADISGLRAETDGKIGQLKSELKADFQTELRSLKYGASIAMAFLSLVVVFQRFIR